MKLCKSLIVLGLTCAATAASAQQMMITITSNQPVLISPLVPPQSSVGLNPTGKSVLRTSMQTSTSPAPAMTKKNRQPDVIISNPNYKLNCYEKSPGVCERIALLLEEYGK